MGIEKPKKYGASFAPLTELLCHSNRHLSNDKLVFMMKAQ